MYDDELCETWNFNWTPEFRTYMYILIKGCCIHTTQQLSSFVSFKFVCVCGIRVLFRLLTCWRIELFRKLVRCPSIYVCSSALSAFVLNCVSKTTTLSDWDWFDKGSVTREEEKKTNICRIYSNGQFWKYYTNQWMIYTLLALELAPNKPFANLSALLCPHMWTQDE